MMNLLDFLKLYLLTIPVFFLIDMLWLGLIARNLYTNGIGHLMADQTNWTAAIIFYLVFIVGILVFAVQPGLVAGQWQKAALWGALFGFFTYFTYDMTNLATLKEWPIHIVVLDLIWGIFLCASVATISWFLGRWLGLA